MPLRIDSVSLEAWRELVERKYPVGYNISSYRQRFPWSLNLGSSQKTSLLRKESKKETNFLDQFFEVQSGDLP